MHGGNRYGCLGRADTVIPIHRHKDTNEVVVVMRGSGCEVTYDDEGRELERVELVAGARV